MIAKIVAWLFFSCLALAQTPSTNLGPDIILYNARVYTDTTDHQRWNEAIAIRGETIVAIGSTKAILKDKTPQTRLIDLKQKLVLPGFNDAHVHLLNAGLALSRVDFYGVDSREKIQKKLKAFADSHSESKVILGQGWDHTGFIKDNRILNKNDLDAVVSEKPVMLWHTDLHYLVVNSKALSQIDLAAITNQSQIEKNEKAEPSGVFYDDAALYVARMLDRPSKKDLTEALQLARTELAKNGVTSVQGGPLLNGPVDFEPELEVLAEAFAQNQKTFRYSFWGSLANLKQAQDLKNKFQKLNGDWFKFETLKAFLDGVLSARTAALLEPYSDDKLKTKLVEPFYNQEQLNELVLAANRAGFTVALHGIGDKAATFAMLAFINAKKHLFNSRFRNRVEHLEVVPPFIYEKFASQSVIASFQPAHISYEHEYQNYNDQRLGKVRAEHAYAWKNFSKARAHLAFGSDWPVIGVNPLVGIFSAVTRQNLDFRPTRGWHPSQKLSLEEAIDGYTMGGAYATKEEHLKGSLREGKFADLVVLDHDLFKIKPKDFLTTKVILTIVGGKIVYSAL